MDIGTRIGGSGNTAANGITDTINKGAPILSQLYGSQRVGCLTTLRDGYHHIALANHRVAVSELRSILHFYRHTTEGLYHLLANQSSMPRGATSHDNDAFGLQHLSAVINQSRECHMVCLEVYTSPHAIGQALRLLKDLLQHKVRIAAFLYLTEIDVDRLYLQFLLLTEDTQHMHVLTTLDDCDISVFQIHHLVGILHDRTGVRADKELVLADAHNQWTLFTGSHNLIGIPLIKNGNGISTDHLIEGHLNSLQQRQFFLQHHIFDQLYQHLSISIADKLYALVFQFLLDIGIIFDDSVVDNSQVVRLRVMGMGIPR